MTKLIEIAIANDLIHAGLIQATLASEGIESVLENQSLQDTFLPMGFATAPRVVVRAEDAERAAEILASVERGERRLEDGDA
jgi:hypothetical protein